VINWVGEHAHRSREERIEKGVCSLIGGTTI
jgi:hypothetical protein